MKKGKGFWLRTERLPQELCELVIDHLDTDVALHTATLVSHSWHPRASLHLLHTVSVNYARRSDWWNASNKGSGRETWRSCTSFLELLRKSARLQTYIHEVIVVSAWTCTRDVIVRVVREVPHLRALVLRGECDSTVTEPGAAAIPFDGTLRLHLTHAAVLLHVLPTFSRLAHLRLRPLHDMGWFLPFDLTGSPHVRVDELTLEGIDPQTVRVLEECLDASAMRKLSLLGKQGADPGYLQGAVIMLDRALVKFKLSLTQLVVDTSYFSVAGQKLSALQHLVALKSLTLILPAYVEDKKYDQIEPFFSQKDITKSITCLRFVSTPATFHHILDDPDFPLSDILHYIDVSRSVKRVVWTLVTNTAHPAARVALISGTLRRLQLVFPEYLREDIAVAVETGWGSLRPNIVGFGEPDSLAH
ncbi:hypothetical protein PsYK624_112710 [Phanerochaete sordida]|uniref:F-box domain-containing protein n=1 Tax=Phanerochaete sordida TaxID=48140 RepID=A0A9P3GHM4_9APHY|nr:hypothetical protein PsYK624_112710 [Phanerochaete sordida]